MWTTNFRNSSRMWEHKFDNGLKVLTDLDLKENSILDSDNKLLSVTKFSDNYALDDHQRFLTTVDNYNPSKKEDHEFGDNMVEE